MLLRYLQDAGKSTPLVAAISISGCFDFLAATADVVSNENAAYNFYLIEQVRICLRRHLANDHSLTESQRQQLTRVMKEGKEALLMYDNFLHLKRQFMGMDSNETRPRMTVNLAGKEHQLLCPRRYYEKSALAHMSSVAVSTLIIHSHDDPVVSAGSIDVPYIVSNKYMTMMTTKRGGHCAFFQGGTPFGASWADMVASRYISAIFEVHSSTAFLLDLVCRMDRSRSGSKSMVPDVSSVNRILSASDLRSFK